MICDTHFVWSLLRAIAGNKAQYSAIINENNNNPGSIWKLFKEIGLNKQMSNASISTVIINGQETEDHNKIANAFNIFLVSVVSKLNEPIENSNLKNLKHSVTTKFLMVQFSLFQKFQKKLLKNS